MPIGDMSDARDDVARAMTPLTLLVLCKGVVVAPTSVGPVPVRPAATVMLVRDAPDLEVLMLRRNQRSIFAPGRWVFPGGAVDLADADLEDQTSGLDDVTASRRLGLESGGVAFWVAAIRECFEEAGVVLAEHDVPTDRLEMHREALNAGDTDFGAIVRQEAMLLDAGSMHYVGHWITPEGAPRRFDTRFFLGAMPEGQVARHDDDEAVLHEWVSPQVAVDRWEDEEWLMMTPTIRMVMSLAAFDRSADTVAAAASERPLRAARVIVADDDSTFAVLPGEPGYETADAEREFGFVGLELP